MPLSLFESALGGIGLFLLGMRIMSDGIRTVADDRVRRVFAVITSNRSYAILFGVMLSLSLNSASAGVIFCIGLANGGVLSVFQAMCVMSGILVGAALTLHLPVLPYSFVATPLVLIGVLLKFFAHRRRISNAGNLILGAGLLFLGLTLLAGSFRPFESHPFYGAFNGVFFRNPLLAMLFGSMITCLVQAAPSAASVISFLMSSYHVSNEVSGIMMLGGLLGIAVIAGFAAIGGTSASRRIAAAFAISVLVCVLPLAMVMEPLVEATASWGGADLAFVGGFPSSRTFSSLAWVYTIASLLMAALLTAISGYVSRMSSSLDDHGNSSAVQQPCAGYLDMRILNTPTLAIEQARKEIVRMMSVVVYMYADTREIFFNYDARRAESIRQHEQVIDSLNHEITTFLAALARSNNNPEISYNIPGMLQTVADLEHIGDRCEDILNCIISRKEGSIVFSEEAMEDMRRLAAATSANLAYIDELITNGRKADLEEIRSLKNSARTLFDELKNSHFERISSGVCPPRAAMLFNELTAAFARIAELSWNITAVRGRLS